MSVQETINTIKLNAINGRGNEPAVNLTNKELSALIAKAEGWREVCVYYSNPEQHIYVDAFGHVLFDNSDEGPLTAQAALKDEL